MSHGQTNRHTWNQGAWSFCARCGDRYPIKEMKWQRGKLMCVEKCIDAFPLIGQIDKGIADKMLAIVMSPDLQPDPKLTQPSLDGVGDDDIFI